MSTSDIKKELLDKLQETLATAANDKNRLKLIEVGQPYVLYLEDFSFIDDAIKELIRKGRPKNADIKDWMVVKNQEGIYATDGPSKAREVARNAHIAYLNKFRIDETQPGSLQNNLAALTVKEKDPRTYSLLGHSAFLVHYTQASGIKREVTSALLSDNVTSHFKKLISRKLDVGHGAGGGLAVSAVTIAKSLEQANRSLREEAAEELIKSFRQYTGDALKTAIITPQQLDSLFDLSINYHQVVDEGGGISASYIAHCRYQLSKYNRGRDRQLETLLLDTTRDYFKSLDFQRILHLYGSSSLFQKISSSIVRKFNRFKNLIVESPYLDTQMKTSGKASTKFSTDKTAGGIKQQPRKSIPVPDISASGGQPPWNLKDLINEALKGEIEARMGSPKLNWRTGRFSGSAIVQNVDLKNSIIDYTYMRYPYEVFEYPPKTHWGERLATPMRDPRLIIGESIREIAIRHTYQYFELRRI